MAVIEDACRGTGLPTTEGRTTVDEARDRLTALGVTFINSAGLRSVA